MTPKKQSMDKVKIKNEEDLTFDKDVVNILLVGSDNSRAQGSEKGDHGRSDSMMVATSTLKTKLKLTSFFKRYV